MNERSSATDAGRRRWLRAISALPLAGSAVAAPAAAAQKTRAHIVIAGSGLGGIAVASRLTKLLDGARITIVDAREQHYYQPGFTLVATGVWSVSKVSDPTADFIPEGVKWVPDMVANSTRRPMPWSPRGPRIGYDFLRWPPGCSLLRADRGTDVADGRNGSASVYAGSQAAAAT